MHSHFLPFGETLNLSICNFSASSLLSVKPTTTQLSGQKYAAHCVK